MKIESLKTIGDKSVSIRITATNGESVVVSAFDGFHVTPHAFLEIEPTNMPAQDGYSLDDIRRYFGLQEYHILEKIRAGHFFQKDANGNEIPYVLPDNLCSISIPKDAYYRFPRSVFSVQEIIEMYEKEQVECSQN